MSLNLRRQEINLHNAVVVARALTKFGRRAAVSELRLYCSDDDALLDAVFYAREYGYIETEHWRIGRATEIWVTGRYKETS